MEDQNPSEPVVLPQLTLGQDVRPRGESLPASDPIPTQTDFNLIQSRCRLKAEGARWAATRRRMIAEGADFNTDIKPADWNITEKARELPGCFLWMCCPSTPSPLDLNLYEELAKCFDTLADAAALFEDILEKLEPPGDVFEKVVDLLAEAQSAVRNCGREARSEYRR